MAASSSPFDISLDDMSPLNATKLHTNSRALNRLISSQTPLKSPERNYIPRLTRTAEDLLAQIHILMRENEELKRVTEVRREQATGKRIALKDQLVLTTEEPVAAIEQDQALRKEKRASKKRKASEIESDTESENDDDDEIDIEQFVEDCIIVASTEF